MRYAVCGTRNAVCGDVSILPFASPPCLLVVLEAQETRKTLKTGGRRSVDGGTYTGEAGSGSSEDRASTQQRHTRRDERAARALTDDATPDFQLDLHWGAAAPPYL